MSSTALLTSEQENPKSKSILNHWFSFQPGFISIEMIVSIGVIIQLLVLFATYVQKNTDQLLENMAAEQLATVHKASHFYVQDHFAELVEELKNLSAGDSAILTLSLDDLQQNQYLAQEQIQKNVFQQTYQIFLILKSLDTATDNPSVDNFLIQLLVSTAKGSKLNELQLRKIANIVGGIGGYVSENGQSLIGACQGWNIALSDEISLETGHNVALSYISQRTMLAADSFLRRYALEGTSEANIMQTHLGVNQKFKLQFLNSDGGEDLSGDVSQRTFFSKDQLQIGPNCQLNAQSLSLKDASGNEVVLTPSSLTFSSKKATADETNAKLTSSALLLSQPSKDWRSNFSVSTWRMDTSGSSLNSFEVNRGNPTSSRSDTQIPYMVIQGNASPSCIKMNGHGYFLASSVNSVLSSNEEVGIKLFGYRSDTGSVNEIRLVARDLQWENAGQLTIQDDEHNRAISLCTYGNQGIDALTPTSLNWVKHSQYFDPYGVDAPYLYFGSQHPKPECCLVTQDGFIQNWNSEGVSHNIWGNMGR